MSVHVSEHPINVGFVERVASVTAGAALFSWGVFQQSLPGSLMAAGGVYLLIRGATGLCPVYEQLDITTARPGAGIRPEDQSEKNASSPPGTGDMVDESSWESFPASDPPGNW